MAVAPTAQKHTLALPGGPEAPRFEPSRLASSGTKHVFTAVFAGETAAGGV